MPAPSCRRSSRAWVASAALLSVTVLLGGTTPFAQAQDPAPGDQGVPPSTRAQSATKLSITWPQSDTVRGTNKFVSGTVSPGGGRRVLLQRKVPGTWHTISSSKARPGGAFKVEVPTDVIGPSTLRLAAPATGSARAASKVRRGAFTVTPWWSPAGPANDFTYLSGNKVAARWDPCETITYRVNAKQASSGALADVRTALSRITTATGLRFKYQGPSNVIPQSSTSQSYGKNTDLLIAWAGRHQSDLFNSYSDNTLGVGGPVWYSAGYVNGDGKAVAWSFKGRVILNAAHNQTLQPGPGPGVTRVKTLMHEVGHVVGLGHARTNTQIMTPTIQQNTDLWGAGDVSGLRSLGASKGCVFRQGSEPAARSSQGRSGLPTGAAWGGYDASLVGWVVEE